MLFLAFYRKRGNPLSKSVSYDDSERLMFHAKRIAGVENFLPFCDMQKYYYSK